MNFPMLQNIEVPPTCTHAKLPQLRKENSFLYTFHIKHSSIVGSELTFLTLLTLSSQFPIGWSFLENFSSVTNEMNLPCENL